MFFLKFKFSLSFSTRPRPGPVPGPDRAPTGPRLGHVMPLSLCRKQVY